MRFWRIALTGNRVYTSSLPCENYCDRHVSYDTTVAFSGYAVFAGTGEVNQYARCRCFVTDSGFVEMRLLLIWSGDCVSRSSQFGTVLSSVGQVVMLCVSCQGMPIWAVHKLRVSRRLDNFEFVYLPIELMVRNRPVD